MITLLGTILLIWILWKVLKFTFKISLGLFILLIPISILYIGYEYFITHRIFIMRALIIGGVLYFLFGNAIKNYVKEKGIVDKVKEQFKEIKSEQEENNKNKGE